MKSRDAGYFLAIVGLVCLMLSQAVHPAIAPQGLCLWERRNFQKPDH